MIIRFLILIFLYGLGWSMLFKEPKIFFIHIPKTAGSSIEHFLHHCQQVKTKDGRLGQHSNLQRAYELYGEELWDFNIFTVLRNPYDRIISLYLMNYKRNSFHFPTIEKFKNRNYVTFPEFYQEISPHHRHAEDVYHYLAIDGIIPDCIKFLDYENVEEHFTKFWNDSGLNMSMDFPHQNKNTKAGESLRNYLKADPEYVKIIDQKYHKELEFLTKVKYYE